MAKGNIYSFTVDREIIKEVESVKTDKKTGEEHKIIKKKTVKEPVKFHVKRPTRRLIEEAETQYAVELSNNMKKGIVTKAMLAKQYSDTGGTLTDSEVKGVLDLMKKIKSLEDEYQLLSATDGDKDKIKELEEEILSAKRMMVDFDTSVQTIYQHTADARAERALLIWYTVYLSVFENEEGQEVPYFEGDLHEDLIEDLYKKDESEGFHNTAVNKLMRSVSCWFYTQSADQETIDKFVNLADE
jgi:hypothetical protein